MASNSNRSEVAVEVFPYLQLYKDGTVHRVIGTEVAHAGLDLETGVLSQDIVINPDTGVSARFYRPNQLTKYDEKLPLVLYFHGGAFMISSTADPKYHISLNKLVAEANIVLVSVNYRLAPENPLPTSYEDSWAALNWVAAHAKGDGGHEPWLKDYVDFEQVFLAGDSAGANIAHNLALRVTDLKIVGIAMMFPYFWGKDPIGVEVTDHFRRELVDKWWMFVCPSDKGNDDPLINPFVDGAPSLKGLACDRVLVTVAEKDILRGRGRLYYDKLVKSGWQGKAEIVEIEDEDHVFHIMDPDSEKVKGLIKRWASFINQGRGPES
ncbi:Abhydrolase_3 domain-containing protein [Cephalotus follicularis]|uniref:Abhydrolase_3 domain-containing protein n=1 Tax=Cephalotus follicularis TaxID=3775 RepID=A0A1Q3CF46_CEPFO|nr:Abhydrolase_3 domain-containing protein [Cephalotus follicularis]